MKKLFGHGALFESFVNSNIGNMASVDNTSNLKRSNHSDIYPDASKKSALIENNSVNVGPNRDINRKRTDYIEWDDYFMSIAFLSAERSKDPSTQVGACIVNDEKKIVGIGYNGMPNGCSDDVVPWRKQSDNRLNTKYPYVVHAELNAILNKNTADVKDCTIYVALFPCNECAKVIIQSGIKEVIFFSDKYHHSVDMEASRNLFDWAGVKYKRFVPTRKKIVIDFEGLCDTFSHKEAPAKQEETKEN